MRALVSRRLTLRGCGRAACGPRLPCISACVAGLWTGIAAAQVAPYDPYAEFQDFPAAVLADGTLHWGPFFKSAALEQNYRRLWNLGACRGTNKAITEPVTRNRVLIDQLPETEFRGIVRHAVGTNAGGVIAFSEREASLAEAEIFFAQLHPAGGSVLEVEGHGQPSFIAPGMFVRFRATVTERGRVTEPPGRIEVVTPETDFVPDAVRPGRRDTIVGQVVRRQEDALQILVPVGQVRRVTVPVSERTEVVVEGTELSLVGPGDTITLEGRLWNGAGCSGAGTVFASRVHVSKPASSPVPAASP